MSTIWWSMFVIFILLGINNVFDLLEEMDLRTKEFFLDV